MRRLMLTTLVVSMLAGCANPVIPIQAPGLGLQSGSSPETVWKANMSLAEARDFAFHVRAKYRLAIATQVDQSQWLSSGLLVLGATIVGLAAGGANSNILLGTSLVGGTGYAMGTINLDKRRLLVFSAGIKALDCANTAVLPLDVAPTHVEALVKAAGDLRAATETARVAGVAVQVEIDKQSASAAADVVDQVAAARAAIASLTTALAEAGKTANAADRLTADIANAGKRLQQTVLEIVQKVDAAMLDTLVDLAAIPQLVAGLGGFAASFAPGAGIDQLIGNSFAKYQASVPAAKSSATQGLETAMQALRGSTDELARKADTVNRLIAGVDGNAVVEALKACDVTGVAFPLTVQPGVVDFTAKVAASRGFAIGGGTKPYSVRALDAFPEPLSIVFDGGFADIAQVRLGSADVPAGRYNVLVSDASSPKRSQQVTVTIGAAASAPTTGGEKKPEDGGAAKGATLDELGKALVAVGPTDLQGVNIEVKAAKIGADGKTLEVNAACTKAPPGGPLKAADVLAKLLAPEKVKALRDKLAEQKLLDDKNSQIVLKSATLNCFK